MKNENRLKFSFYQTVGRGARIDEVTGKLMFRVYDYTDATRLFGETFITGGTRTKTRTGTDGDGDDPPPPEPTISGRPVIRRCPWRSVFVRVFPEEAPHEPR